MGFGAETPTVADLRPRCAQGCLRTRDVGTAQTVAAGDESCPHCPERAFSESLRSDLLFPLAVPLVLPGVLWPWA